MLEPDCIAAERALCFDKNARASALDAGLARGRALQTRQPSARSSRHRKRVFTSSTRAASISSPTTTCAGKVHGAPQDPASSIQAPIKGLSGVSALAGAPHPTSLQE